MVEETTRILRVRLQARSPACGVPASHNHTVGPRAHSKALRDFVDELERVEVVHPLQAFAVNDERQVLGHEARFHSGDDHFFQCPTKACQRSVVVQLRTVEQPARPREDAGDRIGARLATLLVDPVVPCDCAVRSLRLHNVAVLASN